MVEKENKNEGLLNKEDLIQTAKDATGLMKDPHLFQDVATRVKQRMNKLKELTSATHIRTTPQGVIPAQHKTYPPKMHIAGLQNSVSGGVGRISYQVYDLDKKGNKKMLVHKESQGFADFIIKEQILEVFEHRKPMRTEKYGPESGSPL